ncbi:CCA-adding enzyme [Roseovarius sp. THAF8]|uniref:CCA tRNA nucleotidyltransferase n=1 Tax=Roseovarius sp. THAF8 TaxID=2587846 RepID=UPI0012678925|nr:CCA tRNA nucleotidyltransferase [Roseovarius sp. THAF8]QFT97956.1 CCA-adding enzyme [Roseovarius sp. THAF8]
MTLTGDWIDAGETQDVCRMLEAAGHRALLVGGCVRNALMGVAVNDIDISTDARPNAVVALAEAAGMKPVPTGIEHGTVTVVCRGVPFEVTTFRKDVETDGRRAVVAFADDVESDARRRDFTVNALYATRKGEVIDPLGGLPDIAARRIRFIDDAETRIREDYLRILRFFRFHVAYGDPAGGLDPDGLAACAALADGIDGLSKERIGGEMVKLLAARDPAPSVAAMRQAGVLTRVLPGSDDRALAPLVHLEEMHGFDPDAMRRLAALGGDNPADALRLSRKDARRLEGLRNEAAGPQPPEALGYHYGAETARDIVLLRAALFELPVPRHAFAAAELGANAVFPINAQDLMPALEGPALGKALKELEDAWIASGFALDRQALLKLAT